MFGKMDQVYIHAVNVQGMKNGEMAGANLTHVLDLSDMLEEGDPRILLKLVKTTYALPC